jgi:hypothetical protein
MFAESGLTMREMGPIVLLLLTLTPKPVCNAANHGRFWPEAANSSRDSVRRLYKCGALELCSATNRRYRWILLSVHVSQAGRKHPVLPAACPDSE